jgi:hypothetical protein
LEESTIDEFIIAEESAAKAWTVAIAHYKTHYLYPKFNKGMVVRTEDLQPSRSTAGSKNLISTKKLLVILASGHVSTVQSARLALP